MSSYKRKPVEQNQFVITGPFVETIFRGGSYSISIGYTDHAGVIIDRDHPKGQKGRYVEYVTNKDEKGRDKAKRYRFDQSLGRLLTRQSDTDIYGKSQYEFLKNHPECEGSPNGTYEVNSETGERIQTGVTFRELNAIADAEIALRADRERNIAETNAFALDDQTLEEVAALGPNYFGEVDSMMRLKVVEFAKKYPGQFTSILKEEDRGVRAVIRKAIDEGIFRTQTDLIKWESTTIGVNEDDAVATLRKDKDMLKALQDKLGLNVADSKSKPAKKVVAESL